MFKVEKERCIGCGACMSTCKEVFVPDDDGQAYVKAQPTDENIEKAEEALECCPTAAIVKE